MRIITVQQPWAYAIFHGKGVENRSKNLAGEYRGPLAIHAGKRLSERGCNLVPDLLDREEVGTYANTDLTYGAIIGVVDLVDVHREETPDCNCMVPYLDGAGNHSPGCAVFKGCCDSPWAEQSYVEHGGRVRHDIWHHVVENPIEFPNPIPAVGGLGMRAVKDPDLIRAIEEQAAARA